MAPRCVLVGLPGTGKSVVARRVARRLGEPVCDTDQMLGGVAAIAAMWRAEGEAAFRARELDVLARALGGPGVVATGGGAVTTPTGRTLLREAPCVWLRANPEHLVRRASARHRPVLEGDQLARLRALDAERAAWYEEVARATVDATRPLAEVVDEVVAIVTEWSRCA